MWDDTTSEVSGKWFAFGGDLGGEDKFGLKKRSQADQWNLNLGTTP